MELTHLVLCEVTDNFVDSWSRDTLQECVPRDIQAQPDFGRAL